MDLTRLKHGALREFAAVRASLRVTIVTRWIFFDERHAQRA